MMRYRRYKHLKGENMIHYCDCRKKDGTTNHRAKWGQGFMQETSVDNDDVCKYCGHTAFALRDKSMYDQWRYSRLPGIDKRSIKRINILSKSI